MAARRKERSLHPLRENVEVAVFAIVMAMGLKVFAVEAYQIPTGSMQPTLMGTTLLDPVTRQQNGGLHDRVLVDKVTYWFRDPQRWEIVVFRYPLVTHVNYVKRLVGLPGEQLMIANGDLFARPLGSDDDFAILRKPWGLQQTLWKRVIPSPTGQAAAWVGWSETGSIRREEDGSLLMLGSAQAAWDARIKDEPEHGYPDAIAMRVPTMNAVGRHAVADLRWRFSVAPRDPQGSFRADFDFGPYPCRLELAPGGAWTVEGPGGARFAGEAGSGEITFDLAFWDHSLRVAAEPESGEASVRQEDLHLESQAGVRNGARFSTAAGGWLVRPPTAWRDIHYLPPRQNASTPVFDVQPGHYFMMGDNTQSSLDSRDWQAEVIRLPDGEGGETVLRGDYMTNGADPMYNNPRHDLSGGLMTFRDEHGGLHVLGKEDLAGAVSDLVEAAPLVPRGYVLGRAIAVFMPLRPLAPVNRFGLTR